MSAEELCACWVRGADMGEKSRYPESFRKSHATGDLLVSDFFACASSGGAALCMRVQLRHARRFSVSIFRVLRCVCV